MKTIAASAAAMSLASTAFAGEAVHISKNPTPLAPEEFYRAGEIQLGLSALLGVRQSPANNLGRAGLARRSPWNKTTAWGVDAEMNYFITRNFGIGVEQEYFNVGGRPLWNSAFNMYLRAPLHQGSRWAPYLFTGVGVIYTGGQGRFEAHGGGGLEYRFTQKLGTFVDGRYEWVNGRRDVIPQFGSFRWGMRFVF